MCEHSEFVAYIGNTYTGREVNGKLVRPRFSPRDWSVFTRTLEGAPRTNNGTEGGSSTVYSLRDITCLGWHAALNRMFPKAHPTLSQFLIRIRKEEERTMCLYMR